MTKKDLTVEQLIEAAKKEGKVKHKNGDLLIDIQKFLVDFCLVSGDTRYNRHFVYLLYVFWCENSQTERIPLDERLFHKQIRKKIKTNAKSTMYYIDSKSIKYKKDELKKFIIKIIYKRANENVKEKKEKGST